MIITTTNVVEGHPVSEYLGIVTGESIIGANIFRDILASVRDVVGGRSKAYEDALQGAREEAIREMSHAAKSRGADAILAVDLDYEVLGTGNGMLMVAASGTAVTLS